MTGLYSYQELDNIRIIRSVEECPTDIKDRLSSIIEKCEDYRFEEIPNDMSSIKKDIFKFIEAYNNICDYVKEGFNIQKIKLKR